jgi:hypothetical protein
MNQVKNQNKICNDDLADLMASQMSLMKKAGMAQVRCRTNLQMSN